ncbi:MAG: SUMF1/EgtB/PvdO family nonheme iron enzyme [Candidatus Eremiobacteraeota bacterium]|nr:SUMF1/EgtB/PvdO family nonheme iron enzyme [Candidatus Eremiobacteraeota bacterium]
MTTAAAGAAGIETELLEARTRTLALLADLRDDQLRVPLLDILNPFLWEAGHVAFFAEFWTLRHVRGRQPIVERSDALYDSAAVAHDSRWSLTLPSRAQTLAFLNAQLTASLEAVARDPRDGDAYFYRLALHHEDMHAEAMLYARQTLEYPFPPLPSIIASPAAQTEVVEGDARVPAGRYTIGSARGNAFVFDNEKWAHEVDIEAFEIARTPVTNAQFAGFVHAGGYSDERLWSAQGRQWRVAAGADAPLYWRLHDGHWQRRHFDRWCTLAEREPVTNVNRFEAEAYCAWAQRRLPTEQEWEVAAQGAGTGNLDGTLGGPCAVDAFPQSDSRFGCRQMLGNVWEWTSSTFEPYPGFSADPYKEYSEPWFGTHAVLRGGAWSTRERLVSTRWRNFYRPQRRDVFSGLRTCKR